MKRLPVLRSAAGVRREMRSRGFAVVDTRAFAEALATLADTAPQRAPVLFQHPHLPVPIRRFVDWQIKLLRAALPEENIRFDHLSLRHEKERLGSASDRPHRDGGYIRSVCVVFGKPTVVVVPTGKVGKVTFASFFNDIHQLPTKVAELPVPTGTTLFVTATERAWEAGRDLGTLHYRPAFTEPRFVLVTGFAGDPCPGRYTIARRSRSRFAGGEEPADG